MKFVVVVVIIVCIGSRVFDLLVILVFMHCDHLNTHKQISDNEDLHRSAIGWKLDSQAIRAQLSNCT